MWRIYITRAFYKIFLDKRVRIFQERKNKENQIVIRKHTNAFISQYIHKRLFNSFSDVSPNDYEAIVVGSDQIWRKIYFQRSVTRKTEDLFLAFTENWEITRIAYAASFGVDSWDYSISETEKISKLAKKFKAISVREDSGVKLCREMLGVEAKHVLDPTMLLEKSDYVRLIDASGIGKSKGNLFAYILDPNAEKKEFVEKLAKEKGLIPFEVNNPKVYDVYAEVNERIQPPVEEWLRAFYDAEFVVTDSFHACVFSIIFNKSFVTLGNSERGMSRFSSLLGMFNLENHLLMNFSDYIPTTDYSVSEECQRRLIRLREDSIKFLQASLI
jgi:hypothetical protein